MTFGNPHCSWSSVISRLCSCQSFPWAQTVYFSPHICSGQYSAEYLLGSFCSSLELSLSFPVFVPAVSHRFSFCRHITLSPQLRERSGWVSLPALGPAPFPRSCPGVIVGPAFFVSCLLGTTGPCYPCPLSGLMLVCVFVQFAVVAGKRLTWSCISIWTGALWGIKQAQRHLDNLLVSQAGRVTLWPIGHSRSSCMLVSEPRH